MKSVVPLRFLFTCRQRSSFITTPIFYANAAPHLGHLYTAVLADASHRWNRLKYPNDLHIFSTGTDEHGIKILRAAETAGVKPKQFCDEVSQRFRNLFGEYDINHTHYIRTTDDAHKKAVQHVWSILQSAGFIYRDVYSGWYSVVDECFYQDKDVEDSPVKGKTVKVVKGTRTVVEWVEEENYMFKLSEFRERIRDWLTNNDVVQPRHYLPLVLRCLDLDDSLSISRCRKRLPWGIPVPGDESQTIYVWLDALVNYLSVAGYPGDISTSWPPTCQVLGKDIMKFHAVYWPAFLLAAGLPLPEKLFIHGHWLVDNTKMSKSIGNVVDPMDVKETFSSDGIRYFLLKQGLPQDDSNFTPVKALQVINSDLVNNMGNLLSRSTVAKLNPRQMYPSSAVDVEGDAGQLIEELNQLAESTSLLYDELLFYKAIEGIMGVMKQANGLFQLNQPWKMEQGDKLSSILFLSYETIRISAILLQPIVPQFASHALDRLGVDADSRCISKAKVGGGGETEHLLGEDKGPFINRLKDIRQ